MASSRGKSTARTAVRLAIAAFVLIVALPAGAGSTATATFSWERPDRYADTGDSDSLRDPRNATELVNAPFTASVDACASTGAISEYRWTSTDPALTPKSSTSCKTTLEFSEEGAFPVKLAVVTSSGETTTTKTVTIKDFLIVSLGDSFASGEGIPHSFGLGGGLVPLPVNVAWQPEDDTGSSRCHRSAYAGSALAAAWLEQKDPKTSVTFVQLACSGAKIEDQHLWGDRASGDLYFQEGGLLDPYRGVEPRVIGATPAEPPQVDNAAAITGSRDIDAMTISIGGNDLHFSTIIKDCLIGHASRLKNGNLQGCDVPTTPAPAADCGSQTGEGKCAGFDEYREQVARLPARFNRLATRLTAKFGARLDPERVFLLEYPNPTRCDDGAVCPMWSPLITQRESKWANDTVLPGLNGVLKNAAQAKGWTYVGGISDRFETGGHGYPADDSWFISLPRSFAQQGAKDGAFHPNKAGQRWYRNRILAHLGAELAPAVPQPASNVGSDPWDGGPFEDMDLVTDRDGDLIIDLFDNCPSVANVDQADEDHDVNGAEGYVSKDSIGDACGLVADSPGGEDAAYLDGNCDQDSPPGDIENTPCSLSSAISDGSVGGRIVFLNGGFQASSTPSNPVPRVETPLIIDGTATPLTSLDLSIAGVNARLPSVSLPQPRCMAMVGHPCVTIEGDLRFFEANGSEVVGVNVQYENFGLEFERTVNARVFGSRIGSLSPSAPLGGPGLVLRESGVQIGGPDAWKQNVISGNEDGIDVLYNGASPNRIENNLIGTDPTGKKKVGNSGDGISITSSGPVIVDNVIAGNSSNGIAIALPSTVASETRGAVIRGNRIGLNAVDKPLGNGRWGVRIDDSSGHLVGGTTAAQGNQIANNKLGGIQLQAGLDNTFTRNEIWNNGSPASPGALGINLAEDLLDEDIPTRNDALDVDGEPGPPFGVSNDLQNFPTVLSVEKDGGDTRINAALESRPNTAYRLEFFANDGCEPQRHGEGERFLVAKNVTTSDNGKTGLSFTVPGVLAASEYVTATATNPEGSTSEFSTARSRNGPCTATHKVNSLADADDGDVSDGRCDTGTAASGYTNVCTLRAAITQANWLPGHETIGFGIGTGRKRLRPTSSLPEITEGLTIDGASQPGFTGKPLIQLDGADGGSRGLQVVGARGMTIRNLSLTGWSGDAITVRTSPLTHIVGNYVGLLPDGTTVGGNGAGIYLTESPRSTIGGPATALRNVISGNDYGIWLFGTTGNENVRVEGNRVGTNAAGTAAKPNLGDGISVGSDDVLVGGTGAAGNLVSGNGTDGIHVGADADILGNRIGTNAAGTGKIPNGDDGIQLATGSALIGAPSGGGNTIAFNGGNGVEGWAGSWIRRNSIFGNVGLGIDLVPSGSPVQAEPTLTKAGRNGVVRGRITGGQGTYTVEIFTNPGSCNAAVEARKFKKALTVKIPSGSSAAAFATNVGGILGTQSLTATKTPATGAGGTSPISACRAVR